MDRLCFDSYDVLVCDAEISSLEADGWLAVKDMAPWDPAAAMEHSAQAFNDCANNHFDNGNYADALHCYGRALDIIPHYSWAFCNRAAVQLATGNIDAANADYTSAIAIDPDDTALFNGRAFAGIRAAALQDGDAAQTTLQRALEDVDRALVLDEHNGPAYCTKGEILKQMALIAANGATNKAAATAAGGSAETQWTRLLDEAILAQRTAMRLEPEAQEPRDYLRELLTMAEIEEEIPDVSLDWTSRRSIPAPCGDKTGDARCQQGWLYKKGGLKDGERNWIKGGKRNWKLRWVAVDGECIRWYDVKGGKELGVVQLSDADRVELDGDKPNKFCLRTLVRDLWLKAEDDTAAREWVSTLVHNIPVD